MTGQALRQEKQVAKSSQKPSGIEWLGEVPERWEVKRLKHVVCEPLKYGANEAAELDDPSLPRYIRITDVNDSGKLREDTFKSIPEEIAKPYLLKEGDLLFARSGATVGKNFYYEISWGRAAYAGYLIRARCNPKKTLPRFLNYFASSHHYWQWLSSVFIQATIQNVSAEKYANLVVPLPTFDEQKAIVNFLDEKTAQIDALIEKKQRLIELLKEKRTALISHAVTKGLDPNVKMKDSGVEWLGEVPEGWEVRRLKDYGRLVGGAGFPHEFQNIQGEELYFYKVGDLKLSNDGKHLLTSPHTISRSTARSLRATIIPINSVVYAKIGAALLLNRRRLTTAECCIDNNMTAYIANTQHILPDWAFYWLCTIDFGEHTNPGAVPSFSEGYQSILPIPAPTIPEQQSIANFLDEKTAQIDALIEKKQRLIELLKEKRTALISAAVTGKIDVRGFASREVTCQ